MEHPPSGSDTGEAAGAEVLDHRLVRRRLERAGEPPRESCFFHREIGSRMVEMLDAVRLRPRTVVDASAAAGSLVDTLHDRYPRARLVAMEAAHAPALALRRREPRLWGRRARYACASLDALPLATAMADLLVSNLALHRHVIPDAAIAELRRALAPGGLLMLSTLGPSTLQELAEAWRAADTDAHVHAFPDMHDLGDALGRAGFSDVVMSTERLTLHYPDLATLHADLRGLGAGNAAPARPRSLRTRRHLQRAEAAYEARRAEQGLPASMEVVYAHAWAPAPRSVSVNLSPRR